MKTTILNLTFLLLGISLFAQNTWTVDNRPGTTAQFSSVQAAADAAQPGDFIYIHPSSITYLDFSIKKTLHIRGIGYNPELANGESAFVNSISFSSNTSPSTNGSGSSISGMRIGGLGSDSVSGEIHNVIIQNNTIGNISYSNKAENWVIQGNVIGEGNVSNSSINLGGVGAIGSHANNIISNNIIIDKLSAGASTISGLLATDTFSNNLVILQSVDAQTNKTIFTNCNNPVVNNNMFVIVTTNTLITEIGTSATSTISFQNCLACLWWTNIKRT